MCVPLRCTPAEACEKTGFDLTKTCTRGYEGFLCGQCSDGYYRTGQNCKECPGAAIKWITILAALSFVAFILGRVTSRKTELPVEFRITLQAMQTVALYPNITQKWPRFVRVVLQIYSVAVTSPCIFISV
jgi:hypothetical protein